MNPLVADGRRLPFNDASVDGYTSVNLVNIPVRGLEAEKFVKGLLAEAYRVLKESGFILINSFGYMLQLKDGVLVGVNNNINPSSIITIDKLKELLHVSGFVDIETLPVDQNLVREVERSSRDMLRKSDPRIDTACVEYGGFLAFKKKR